MDDNPRMKSASVDGVHVEQVYTSDIDKLQIRIDALETRLRYALAALEAAMKNQRVCPVCLWSGGDHNEDCIIGLAQSIEPQDIGER